MNTTGMESRITKAERALKESVNTIQGILFDLREFGARPSVSITSTKEGEPCLLMEFSNNECEVEFEHALTVDALLRGTRLDYDGQDFNHPDNLLIRDLENIKARIDFFIKKIKNDEDF